METDTTSRSTLQVGQVLKSTWLVIRKNFVRLIILATIIHPVSWKLAQESSEFFKGYSSYVLDKETYVQLGEFICIQLEEFIEEVRSQEVEGVASQPPKESAEEAISERMNSEVSIPKNCNVYDFNVHDFLAPLLFVILLQVAFTQLTFDTLKNPQLSMSQRHVFGHFQRTEFFFDVLRSIGIVAVSYVALFAFLVVEFGILAMAVVLSGSYIFIVLALCVMVLIALLMIFSVIRISVAIPMTVIENSSVMKSLIGSWRIIAPCWKKFLGIFVMLFVLLVLLGMSNELVALATDNPIALSLIGSAIGSSWEAVTAVCLTVCYYYLRETEGIGSTSAT